MVRTELLERLNTALNYAKNSPPDQPADTLATVVEHLESLVEDVNTDGVLDVQQPPA